MPAHFRTCCASGVRYDGGHLALHARAPATRTRDPHTSSNACNASMDPSILALMGWTEADMAAALEGAEKARDGAVSQRDGATVTEPPGPTGAADDPELPNRGAQAPTRALEPLRPSTVQPRAFDAHTRQGLTEVQRMRIAANRRVALERRAQAAAQPATATTTAQPAAAQVSQEAPAFNVGADSVFDSDGGSDSDSSDSDGGSDDDHVDGEDESDGSGDMEVDEEYEASSTSGSSDSGVDGGDFGHDSSQADDVEPDLVLTPGTVRTRRKPATPLYVPTRPANGFQDDF
jgi:hypothetical protein